MATAEDLETWLLALAKAHGPGTTLDPQEVARAIGGDSSGRPPDAAGPSGGGEAHEAGQGRHHTARAGPLTPGDFKGTYRIVLPDAGTQRRQK
jgi:hypothetical protein